MKRNKFFMMGILALALVFGFISCDGGGGEGAKGGTTVTALDLTDLATAPKTGATPQAEFVGNDQYGGVIAWQNAGGGSHSGVFAASTVYKAVVTLTAKEGFTFEGVGANMFTYNGATATNAANSGIVTITFPQTETAGIGIDNLASYLSALPSNTASTPHTVSLSSPDSLTGVWGTVNSTVQSAEKYVVLDLSNCFFTDNTVSGALDSPSDNNLNIIKDNSYIKGVILPDTLTTIGAYAFGSCSGLTSVTIPNSVTTIGYNAFESCNGLTSVAIPNSVTSIAPAAFRRCSGLTSVTIPNSVTTIGYNAFEGCIGLTAVTIPNSVTTIENGVFQNCIGLTRATIPSSVTTIEILAFWYCSNLTSVTFETGSNITVFSDSAFPDGDNGITRNTLRTAYQNADPHSGTYTSSSGGSTWTKLY